MNSICNLLFKENQVGDQITPKVFDMGPQIVLQMLSFRLLMRRSLACIMKPWEVKKAYVSEDARVMYLVF